MSYLMLFLGVLFNVFTNMGFKYAAMVQYRPVKKWSFFGIALLFGLANSLFVTEALKTLPLNVVTSIFFSMTIVGLLLVSYFIFHEQLNYMRVAGIAVIISGVVIVTMN
jgi:multidrug transporter EmrE-like cation transporter